MEQFADFFQQRGFVEVRVNIPSLSIFMKRGEEKDYAILLYQMPQGNEWIKEQCAHVEEQLHNQLSADGKRPIELMSFLCTNAPNLVRDIYRNNEHTAVIDLESKRLLLFEGMAKDQLCIYHDLEELIQTGIAPKVQKSKQTQKMEIKAAIKKIGVVNACVIIINVLVYIVLKMTHQYDRAVDEGALFWYAVSENHQYYRLFTSMFLHGGLDHLFNNMLILAVIGQTLEKKVGKVRYLIIYLLSGIVAGFVSMSYNMEKVAIVRSIGASGAIFGVIGAVLFIVLIHKGKVENLSKRQMILFVALSLYGGFTNQGVDNVAHVGGLIAGFLIAMIVYRRPKKRGMVS